MEIEERLARLHSHVEDHPKDYQAVIAELKARSDYFEHRAYLQMIDKKKRVAEIKKRREEYAKQVE